MSIILHIAKRKDWKQAKTAGIYRGDTLDSQGFIHCSKVNQVVRVANSLFRGQKDLVLLRIKPDKVKAEIRYESGGGEELFPHIYGPLNKDAVIKVLDLEPGEDGFYRLPKELRKLAR